MDLPLGGRSLLKKGAGSRIGSTAVKKCPAGDSRKAHRGCEKERAALDEATLHFMQAAAAR